MADRDDEETIAYTVTPHRHHVVLERRGDDTVLRHIATREEHALPNSDWSLHFDDEGYGVLVNEVSEQVQLVEDIFRLKLVQDQYGKLEIMNETGVKSKVDGHLSWYRCGNVQWPGPAGTMLEVPICKLAVPKRGYALYWRLGCLYTAMGKKSHKEQSTKWIYSSRGRWMSFCEPLHIEKGIIQSAGQKDDAQDHGDDCFLPFLGCSTPFLLAIGIRLLHPIQNKGGLQAGATKENSHIWMTSLISAIPAVCPELDISFKIPICWSLLWEPRNKEESLETADILLDVLGGGFVDVAPWQRLLMPGHAFHHRHPAVLWFDALKGCGAARGIQLSRLLLDYKQSVKR